MDIKISHLYCYECSLQFDTKYVFDIHLSVTHGKKLDIKQEPDSQASLIPETKEFEIKHPYKGNGGENESKIRKCQSRDNQATKERNNSIVTYVMLSLDKRAV